MKKGVLTIDMVREKIDELVGKNINMQVCRGRKQIKKYTGVIENAFSRVFVVKLDKKEGAVESLSYSYSDILCGDVVINDS
ncbi:MAG: Veg family protein [Firmicutes bacterium]|nr:Veg family protein [Bacillota bacterium]